MIPTTHYHGAHRPPLDGLPPVAAWSGHGVTAFAHDLLTDGPLPVAYEDAEVIVADLPWRFGFDIFNTRAGVEDDRSYAEFLDVIATMTESLAVPTYWVTGRHALPSLPAPDAVLPMRLNTDDAVAVGYRCGDEADGAYGTSPEFLHALTTRYAVAGDPCCGYGRTARVFLRAGGRAVVSDMNPQCIGYIAQHAGEWIA